MIFLLLWVAACLMGLINPVETFKLFSTAARVLSMDPQKINHKRDVFLRFFFGFFLLIGLFIYWNMVTGQLRF
jgi:hypothetical protein